MELSSENKGLKQAQDRSVEMTVNKPPSWVKHVLKYSPGYQVSTFSSKRFVLNAKRFVDRLIPALEDVEVIEHR